MQYSVLKYNNSEKIRKSWKNYIKKKAITDQVKTEQTIHKQKYCSLDQNFF